MNDKPPHTIERSGLVPLSLANVGGRQLEADFAHHVREAARHMQEGDFAGQKTITTKIMVEIAVVRDESNGLTFIKPYVSSKLPRETRPVAAVRMVGDQILVDEDLSDPRQLGLHPGGRDNVVDADAVRRPRGGAA